MPGKDRTDRIDKTEKKDKKTHAPKSKNYDEGVFDITKVDMNQVADKLKKAGMSLLGAKIDLQNHLRKMLKKTINRQMKLQGLRYEKPLV